MTDSLLRLAAVGLGGALGAMARYGVGIACFKLLGDRFGYGTLVVNAVGCFLLGFLMHEAWSSGEKLSGHVHVGLTVGLLGGLTTFSTFGYQTLRHIERGELMLATLNVVANLVVGLAAAMGGLLLARSAVS